MEFEFCLRQILEIFIIHKPFLGSSDWRLPFIEHEQTDRHPDRQAKYKDRRDVKGTFVNRESLI